MCRKGARANTDSAAKLKGASERVVRSHKGPQRENVLFEAIEASRVALKNLIQVKVFLKIKKLPTDGIFLVWKKGVNAIVVGKQL